MAARYSLQRRRRNERGYSLLEIAIVVSITAIISAGIWVAASRIQRNIAINTATGQLYQIVDNVRGIYASQPGIFVTATAVPGCGAANFNSRLSCQGAFPPDIIQGGAGGFAFHEWDQAAANGSVQVDAVASNLAGNEAAPVGSFGVRFLNLPLDVCITMAAQNSQPDQDQKLKAVLFLDNLGNVTNAFSSTDWAAVNGTALLPVLPPAAVAACQNAAGVGGTTASVEWVFMLR